MTAVAVDLGQLAAAALAEAESHPKGTPERRAASHLWVALTVPPATTTAAARRAIASFGSEATQAAALELLHRLGGRQ